jgi:3-deoxy-7-phosphoheptulonate synthase
MIVAMQERQPKNRSMPSLKLMEEAGVNVHRTTGATQSILAGVGPTANVDLTKFEVLPGVLSTCCASVRLTSWPGAPFGRKARWWSFANGVTVGGERVAVMAGPCAIENREQIFATAARVKAAGASFLRGGAFKPRSSPYAFQGLGIPGLQLMHEAAEAHGLLTVSEVMEISQIEPMLPYTDLFPGGRAQYAELQPAARTGAGAQACAAEARHRGHD